MKNKFVSIFSAPAVGDMISPHNDIRGWNHIKRMGFIFIVKNYLSRRFTTFTEKIEYQFGESSDMPERRKIARAVVLSVPKKA